MLQTNTMIKKSKTPNIPKQIDLHGLSIEKGYNKTLMYIKMLYLYDKKAGRIITGRSGEMNKEFKKWMVNPLFKKYIGDVHQDFHKGSWVVWINQK